MLTKDFYFDLPDELIAQEPSEKRGEDRLLVLDKNTGEYRDMMMSDFPSLLPENSVLVVNNSKVRKARTYAESIETKGVVEFLSSGQKGGKQAGKYQYCLFHTKNLSGKLTR